MTQPNILDAPKKVGGGSAGVTNNVGGGGAAPPVDVRKLTVRLKEIDKVFVIRRL
jgi:hypothetical protein